MPITDYWSYLTTGTEIEAHWTDVNADRVGGGGTALAMPDGSVIADLTADLAELQTALTAVENADNDRAIATGGRDSLKETLRGRLIEFREGVGFRLKGTGYVRALPDTTHVDASEERTLKALGDMEGLWGKINGAAGVPNFTPPLVLRDAYALAAFSADLQTLRTQYRAVTDGENDLRIARSQRDRLLRPLRDRLVTYRQAIQVEYGPEHPFTTSLPEIYPPPGSTPDAVVATGQYIETEQYARITWVDSTAPNVSQYELRYSSPPTYNTDTDIVVANIEPGIQQAITTHGLANPGDTALYKVYVVLSTGNEAGSNTVTITRP